MALVGALLYGTLGGFGWLVLAWAVMRLLETPGMIVVLIATGIALYLPLRAFSRKNRGLG